ncbi:MAG: hypothetical protein ACT4PO_07685 [Actinomycetota bacterium]
MNWKDIVERVAFTGAEAFLAVLVASGAGYVNVSTLRAAAIAAGAAAIAALKVAIQQKTAA